MWNSEATAAPAIRNLDDVLVELSKVDRMLVEEVIFSLRSQAQRLAADRCRARRHQSIGEPGLTKLYHDTRGFNRLADLLAALLVQATERHGE